MCRHSMLGLLKIIPHKQHAFWTVNAFDFRFSNWYMNAFYLIIRKLYSMFDEMENKIE